MLWVTLIIDQSVQNLDVLGVLDMSEGSVSFSFFLGISYFFHAI